MISARLPDSCASENERHGFVVRASFIPEHTIRMTILTVFKSNKAASVVFHPHVLLEL